MAYDKAVDSAVLDANLKAIADAIREKGGTSDPIAFDAMADAIAAIETGGDVVTGTFTCVSESENVILADAIPIRSQVPIAAWIYEVGLNYTDTTHTKRRLLCMLYARKSVNDDITGAYYGSYLMTPAGSNSLSADKINANNLWNGSNQNTTWEITSMYNSFKGNYKDGSLFFGCNGANYGLTAGRTYMWGVSLWPE